MARDFTSSSSEYLSVDSAPLTAYPMTLAFWFYSESASAIQWGLWVGDKDSGSESMSVAVGGWLAGDPVVARAFAGSNGDATSSSGYSINTWHHACGVFVAQNERSAFIDGGNKGTDTTDYISIGQTYDRITVGRFDGSSPNYYMDGRIAEAAIWNVELTDAEVAILGKGFSPLFIRPESLVFYAPLIRDEDDDRVGGLSLTAYNTPTVATHPPIIYPTPPFLSFPVAAAGGTEIEVPVGTLTIAGKVPTVAATANVDIDVPIGTLDVAGKVPSVGWSGSATVPLGTLAVAGKVPTAAVTANVEVDIPIGALVVAGLVPSIGWSGDTSIPVGTLVIAGKVPTAVGVGATAVTVPIGTIVIAGLVPSVGWSGDTNIPVGALVLAGKVPAAVATTGVDITIPLALLALAGKVPGIGWSGSSSPPLGTLVIAGKVPTAVEGVTAVDIGAFPQPPITVAPPARDVSFPVDRFYAALDNEAQKMRSVVNQAYKDAEEEAEELKRAARYARDEALDAIYNDLRQVNRRMEELGQAKTDIRSMQMRRRLEDARKKKPAPPPKKKKKDRRPKLTKLKKKQYKKK